MKIVFALCCGIIFSAMGDAIKDCSVREHTLKISIPEGWEDAPSQVAGIVAKGRQYGGVDPNNQFVLCIFKRVLGKILIEMGNWVFLPDVA